MKKINLMIPKSEDLLQVIVKFLNFQDVSFEKIQRMINDSTTDQLILAFTFLTAWIISNQSNMDTKKLEIRQLALNLIDCFATKVPPLPLITGFFSQKLGFDKVGNALFELLKPFLARFQKLASILYPISFYHVISNTISQMKIPKVFLNINNPYLEFSSETDPCFHDRYMRQFKRLILDHSSLDQFDDLFKLQNSKFILTQSLIYLIGKLNNERKMTHPQLLYMFSVVFIYINAFLEKDQIDGQLLIQGLQDSPYISPFCMLAFINHIQKDSYLFNLYIPSPLATKQLSKDEALQVVKTHYHIVDFSLDNSLNDLFPVLPSLILSYFQPVSHNSSVMTNSNSGNNLHLMMNSANPFRNILSSRDNILNTLFNSPSKTELSSLTDCEIMIYIHQCGITLFERLKEVILLAREGKMTALHAASMDLKLMKFTVLVIMRFLKELILNGLLNENLYKFLIILIASILPTCSNQLVKVFFSLPIVDVTAAELYLRLITLNSMNLVLFSPAEKDIITFTFECLKMNGPIQLYARLLMFRYFSTMSQAIPLPQLKKHIQDCNDVVILISILLYIDNIYYCNNYIQYSDILEIRSSIITKLPFRSSDSEFKPFFYDSIKIEMIENFNLSSNAALKNAQKFDFRSDPLLTLAILVHSSQLKKNAEFTQNLINTIIEFLHNQTDLSTFKCPFVITVSDLYKPIALYFFPRLLLVNNQDGALQVLQAIKDCTSNENDILSWIVPILSYTYPFLTHKTREILISMISQLRDAKKYFIIGEDMVFKNTTLFIESETTTFQDPETIQNSYKPFLRYVYHFVFSAFILSFPDKHTLVESLIYPVFDTTHAWKDRCKHCFYTAIIAAHMPTDIGFDFVMKLLDYPHCNIAIETIRCFFAHSELKVYRKVCKLSYEIIRMDDDRLETYLNCILINYGRLEKDEEVATQMLCGILQSVKDTTPRTLQELVIDLIGLLYSSLDLQKSRGKLINASTKFPPELRTIIASSLDIKG